MLTKARFYIRIIFAFWLYGGIAQLARALGSYPSGRGFKSNCRYQFKTERNNAPAIWPVGQAVKTPPFHGGNRSSILLRVTKFYLQGVFLAGNFFEVLRMDLNNIKTIREILERHGFHFSKALGQNFLTAAWVPREIVAQSEIDESVGVLEIGPGMGCLTRELAKKASKVVAVEIDKALMPVLNETVGDLSNLEIINNDILKIDLEELSKKFDGLKKYVCANLPYYITTPILSHLLESRLFESVSVMMQKEVAHRLCAKPGTADYGAFTVFVQYYSEPEILFDVPKGCFVPQPKIDSAVVRLHVREVPPVEVADEKLFFRVVRASFAQRRKQLVNGLTSAFGSDFTKAELSAILEEVGLSASVRGETLSISQFADIANLLYKRLLDK